MSPYSCDLTSRVTYNWHILTAVELVNAFILYMNPRVNSGETRISAAWVGMKLDFY